MSGSEISRFWQQLDRIHSKEMMEGPGDVDHNKVLELASSYLGVVLHYKKFNLLWLGDLLVNSMKLNQNFSLEKASEAFHLLEQQASFMIRFPFSPHSKTISCDSSVYQKVQEGGLEGVDQLFLEMGFNPALEPQSLHRFDLGPSQATLLKVGRDWLLAKVECNLMADIQAGLDAAGVQVSLVELADFRKDHIGSVEQAIVEIIRKENVSYPIYYLSRLTNDTQVIREHDGLDESVNSVRICLCLNLFSVHPMPTSV